MIRLALGEKGRSGWEAGERVRDGGRHGAAGVFNRLLNSFPVAARVCGEGVLQLCSNRAGAALAIWRRAGWAGKWWRAAVLRKQRMRALWGG